jgi:DNA-binding response OmpR family regulator
LAADSRPEPDGIALSRGGGADTHPQDLAPPLSPESSRAFQERLRALPAAYEIRLDRSGRSARIDGVTRRLTKREFELLAELAARPGEPVSRDRLLAVGADGRDLGQGSRAVDVHIAHLRDKLALPGVIATVRGRGYALNPAYAVLFAD